MRNSNNSHDWERGSRDGNPRYDRRGAGRDGSRSNRYSSRDEGRENKPFRPRRDSNSEGRSFGPRRQESFPQRSLRPRRNADQGNDRRIIEQDGKKYYRTDSQQSPYSRKRIKRRRDDFAPINEQPKRNFSQPKPENQGKTRLNKFIANAGICSRREADVLISTGVITVNGEVITEMGFKVMPGDVVKYNGRELKDEKKVYLLLNKPKGYITTVDDPQKRHTVMELIDDACSERIYPVGRLDRNTTGLLLFTNDGDLTKKLTHPSYGAQKVYNVKLDKPVAYQDFKTLLEGVELEDGFQQVDNIDYSNNVPLDRSRVGVSIHSGKNRIVRRLFESLGYEVVKLDRVYFAGLTKKNLMVGQYRFLDEKEIAFLKMDK